MHIIAFEHEPTSKSGGQELNLLEICQNLTHRGHRVSLVYTKPGDLLDRYSKFGTQLVQVDRYQAARKSLPAMARFLKGINADLKKIQTTSDSVLFCNDFGSTFFASRLAKRRGIPLVQYLQLPGNPFKIKWRPGLAAVDRIITVSQATKTSWVENSGVAADRIEVVYNGPDLDTFYPCNDLARLRWEMGLDPEAFVCLFIGRLNPLKGIEVLLKSFAKLVACAPQARLLVAGEPVLEPGVDSPQARIDYKQQLLALVRNLGIESKVQFLGHVADTPRLYRVSDVTVVPSIWPDPCPRVVQESFASGTPVVGSRIGGIPEQFTAAFDDWLCLPDDENSLLKTLQSMVGWRQSQPALAKHCRNHILENFTPTKMMNDIERILGETIKDSSHHQVPQTPKELVAAGKVAAP